VLFHHYTARAAEFYAAQFARRYEPPTINPFMDEHLLLDELPDYRGDLCGAGHTFVRIVPEGQVRRCGPDDIMGHLVEGWFERRSQPSPCTDLECPYFCEKYRLAPYGEAPSNLLARDDAPMPVRGNGLDLRSPGRPGQPMASSTRRRPE
jgi:hypothetical protein